MTFYAFSTVIGKMLAFVGAGAVWAWAWGLPTGAEVDPRMAVLNAVGFAIGWYLGSLGRFLDRAGQRLNEAYKSLKIGS
jgi:hypothetical protein